ncbi:MAG: peptide-modifying radical SAM enzyme CbpB, partial [Nitrospirae bacterium]|nr:peptide-modifying radical SAM enzyme CbpB [Nitrospirota bacterium]
MSRGLLIKNINESWQLALDPENVFWGALPRSTDGEIILPEELMDMYNDNRELLDKQMYDFRFGIDLNCIYIDPTDRCNADCPYCYIPPQIRKGGEQMTYEQLDTILDKINVYFKAKKKKPVIVFHAAEPLLVKDILFKAIEKYHESLLFGIQTNAILLEKSDVEFMKKYRIGVGISIDSSVEEINNISRAAAKGGNFSSAVKALDWFDGYAGLNVICTVTNHNVSGLSQLVEFLHSKHVSCVLLNPVRTTRNPALKIKADEKEFYHALVSAVEKAMDLTQKTGQQIIVGNFTNIILAIISPMARRMMCDISPCGGGRTFVTITASGDILPCGEFTGFREFSGGNIFNTSIDEALDSEPFHKVRSRHVENISECSD